MWGEFTWLDILFTNMLPQVLQCCQVYSSRNTDIYKFHVLYVTCASFPMLIFSSLQRISLCYIQKHCTKSPLFPYSVSFSAPKHSEVGKGVIVHSSEKTQGFVCDSTQSCQCHHLNKTRIISLISHLQLIPCFTRNSYLDLVSGHVQRTWINCIIIFAGGHLFWKSILDLV